MAEVLKVVEVRVYDIWEPCGELHVIVDTGFEMVGTQALHGLQSRFVVYDSQRLVQVCQLASNNLQVLLDEDARLGVKRRKNLLFHLLLLVAQLDEFRLSGIIRLEAKKIAETLG